MGEKQRTIEQYRMVWRHLPWLLLLLLLMVTVTGCGTVQHKVEFNDNYIPELGTKIEVGNVLNVTKESFDISIEKMLADALAEELKKQELLWVGAPDGKIILESRIVEYKKGSAFKRWLMPGWGATVLSVQCDLKNEGKVVGAVEAKRTVDAGGGYTIGAWEYVFPKLAKDIVKDLRKQIKQQSRSKDKALSKMEN